MELKSTQGTSFSFQSKEKEKGKDIKYHQIQDLLKCNTYTDVFAGFIFDFRKSETYWLSIVDFNRFYEQTDKKSINEKNIITFGGIKIDKRIKKVNYSYDVVSLLNKIVVENV